MARGLTATTHTNGRAPAAPAGTTNSPLGFRVVVAAGIAALVGAIALSVAVMAEPGPLAGDLRITRELQEFDLRNFAQSTRNMNNFEATALAGSIGVAGLWFCGRRQQAVILACGLFALLVLTYVVKEAVDRPRPSPELINVTYFGRSPSFPSGHSISSTMLYGYLVYVVAGAQVRRELRWGAAIVALALAAANGIGTIHSGTHWPSDVLGGYLWATVLIVGLICADRAVIARRGADASRAWHGAPPPGA
jgi:membrane-associated phospholipid phosphatase